MFSSKYSRILVLAILVAAGAWLAVAPSQPGPESAANSNAIRSLAPQLQGRDIVGAVISTESGNTVDPVAVDLADIPTGVYDPDNQLDAWNNGEIDLDEEDGIVSAAEKAERQEASLRLPPSGNVERAESTLGFGDSFSGGASFESLDYTDCCGGGGSVPPDPELAVGPNHVVAAVNAAFEIYDKNGALLSGPTTLASFMSAGPGCSSLFDPNVLYDEQADRFIIGADADGLRYCLAVSQTSDPTGSWNIYSFLTGGTLDFFDYPHIGVGNDAIYMGGNIFDCTFFCNMKEARVWAFDKNAMYAGQSTGFVSRSLGSSADTPQPLHLHGWEQGTWPSSGPHYIFAGRDFNGETYTVYSWNDPFGANTLNTVNIVDLAAATGVSVGIPVNVPQMGGNDLQANDYRPQDFEYRNGYAYSTQTIACNPGGGTVNCVRWAQIDLASGTVVDARVYGSNGEYRTFADLAVNHCGDVGVGYTKSSANMYPGVWYTGWEAGSLQSEVELKAGEVSYVAFDAAPHRWGDYTEMTIAPDGLTMWYLGQYSKNTGTTDGRWGTYIGAFSFANCTVDAPPPPTPTPTTPPPTPTATPAPVVTIHVGDLDGSASNGSRGRWNASVTITVHDADDNPVAGVTVSGDWGGGAKGSGSCVTDSNGQCTVTKSNLRKSTASFTITGLDDGSSIYDAGSNHDPDGDSNGTVIVVNQP